jgi:NADPH2:quinone reductase
MKAIRVNEHGGPEVLNYEDVEVPEPGEGEARVKLAASGVNFIDTYQRTGLYPRETPFTLGLEGAGEVEAVGEGVEEISEGDYVAFAGVPGAYAEYIVAPAERLVPFNATLVEARVAAAVMLQGMTAHYLTHSTFSLQEGHTALVHAAAGGVGLLLCQIAKLRGATVIGTAGTEEKAELAKGAGADEVIIYTEQEFVEETNRITNGEGVDVVYDSVGKDTFDGGLDVLKPRGYMVLPAPLAAPCHRLTPRFSTRRVVCTSPAPPSSTTPRPARSSSGGRRASSPGSGRITSTSVSAAPTSSPRQTRRTATSKAARPPAS